MESIPSSTMMLLTASLKAYQGDESEPSGIAPFPEKVSVPVPASKVNVTNALPLVAGAASMDMIYFSNVQMLIMGEVTPEECARNMQNECTAAMQG